MEWATELRVADWTAQDWATLLTALAALIAAGRGHDHINRKRKEKKEEQDAGKTAGDAAEDESAGD